MKKVRRAGVLLAPLIASYAQVPPEAAKICAARAASNRAIMAGDLPGVAESLEEDFTVIVGDGTYLTRQQYVAAFEADFGNPESMQYERVADTVEVSTAGPLAAEHGHWSGRLRDGRVLFTGTYMAMWRRAGTEWKLRSELFVSLTCVD